VHHHLHVQISRRCALCVSAVYCRGSQGADSSEMECSAISRDQKREWVLAAIHKTNQLWPIIWHAALLFHWRPYGISSAIQQHHKTRHTHVNTISTSPAPVAAVDNIRHHPQHMQHSALLASPFESTESRGVKTVVEKTESLQRTTLSKVAGPTSDDTRYDACLGITRHQVWQNVYQM